MRAGGRFVEARTTRGTPTAWRTIQTSELAAQPVRAPHATGSLLDRVPGYLASGGPAVDPLAVLYRPAPDVRCDASARVGVPKPYGRVLRAAGSV
jgi:hypothetical protein